MSTFKIDKITAISANSNLIIQGEGTGKVSLGDSGLLFPDTDGSSNQVLKTNGDGVLSWTTDAILTDEQVQDTVGAMLTGNTETGIIVTYDSGDGTIDFVIQTLNQDTTGNAATATALETARTIHGVSFDGTGNIDLSEVLRNTVGAMVSGNTETGITVTYNDSAGVLNFVVNTLDQDTTGNAATATALETARTIHGVSFDGTGNIDLSEGIADTVGAMVSGNTETNISVTFNTSDNTLDFEIGTLNQDTTGNAATATVLQTARTIGGVSFNGGSNINLPGVNTAGNQSTTGNAATSTKLATPRTVGMTGDVVWTSASFDGSGNVTGTATIQPNSVSMGTDTTGNYVATVSGTTNEIEVSGSGGETAGITIGLPDNVTIGGALTVTGNLTINGTTTTISTTNTTITDNLIELNSGTSSNANDSGILIERGSTGDNAIIMWDESTDKFQVGTTTATATSTGNIAVTTGTLVANIEGDVTGNADTATTLETARTIGGVSFNGGSNINLPGVNTSGNQNTSGNAATATALATARTIHGVSFDGTANIDLSEVIADTIGDMVSSNTETNISVTFNTSDNTLDFVIGTLNQNTTGNAATATRLETARTIGGVSFNGTSNINLPGVNTAGNQNTSGNAATATALATSRTIGMTGDVVWTSTAFNGSVNVSGTATIQPNSVDGTMIALGSDAAGDVMYYNGTNYARLAKGSNDEVLTLASGVPSWAAIASAGEAAFKAQSTPGVTPTATGTDAVAIGDGAVAGDAAADLGALAFGARSSAIGINSIAIGEYTDATGAQSIAIGGASSDVNGADAGGSNAVAIGYNTSAGGSYTVAIGINADASSSGAISLGDTSKTTAADAIAMGTLAHASGTESVAIGRYTDASGNNSIAIGGASIDGDSADATATRAIAIGHSTDASSTETIALGYSAKANSSAAIAIGYESEAYATRAISIGRDTRADGTDSVSLGYRSKSQDGGQFAFASGYFAAAGDAQTSVYVLRNTTTSATQTELFADGSSADISVPNDSTIMFKASVVARRTDADNESAAYILEGCVDNNNGTTALVGSLGTKTILSEDRTNWDVTITADNTNNGINVLVTGEASKNIRWVAKVEITVVSG